MRYLGFVCNFFPPVKHSAQKTRNTKCGFEQLWSTWMQPRRWVGTPCGARTGNGGWKRICEVFFSPWGWLVRCSTQPFGLSEPRRRSSLFWMEIWTLMEFRGKEVEVLLVWLFGFTFDSLVQTFYNSMPYFGISFNICTVYQGCQCYYINIANESHVWPKLPSLFPSRFFVIK